MQRIDKDSAYLAIDNSIGDVMLAEYDFDRGVSNNFKRITKKRGKRIIDKAKTVLIKGKSPMIVLELQDKILENLENYIGEGKVKQLLLYIEKQKVEQMF